MILIKRMTINLTFFFVFILILNLSGQVVQEDEARKVAENWIGLILKNDGNWGDSPTASIVKLHELTDSGRKIGYFCHIWPHGYILISPRKELSPIKAYSEMAIPDLDRDKGMIEFIKLSMTDVLNKIEKKAENKQSEITIESKDIIRQNYVKKWETFISGNISMALDDPGVQLPLKTDWHQDAPFNYYCPEIVGSSYCKHAKAGCVAIAAAQIMRYWCWPPTGQGSDDGADYKDSYDWKNMAYIYNGTDDNWIDENRNELTSAHVEAVAELCQEIGEACGMDYGCDESSAWVGGKPGTDMKDAFIDHFRYNENLDFEIRKPGDDWFTIIKDNINANQPIQYSRLKLTEGLAGHSMVLHGWKVTGGTKLVLMNFGWKTSAADHWYNIDNIEGNEGMIRKIRPAPSLKESLSGDYSLPSYPYRYFNINASGTANFAPGHRLQFLPGVKVTSTQNSGIKFNGTPANNTYFFTNGILNKGVRILNGKILLHKNGCLHFTE